MELTEKNIKFLVAKSILDGDVKIALADLEKIDIIYASDALLDFFGTPKNQSKNEMIDYWLHNFVHPEDVAEQKEYIKTGIFPRTRTYRRIDEKGNIKWVRVDTSDIIQVNNKKIMASLVVDLS